VVGQLGFHGEVRRVLGVLSLAYMAKAGQKLIVPTENEKEAALILAKPGHEGCGVYPVSLLSEVTECFAGRRSGRNARGMSRHACLLLGDTRPAKTFVIGSEDRRSGNRASVAPTRA
jgi:predicted ATPase with chaperone activity